MKCKAWEQKKCSNGRENTMRKGLEVESYDLNLKQEGREQQRKAEWNGHILTGRERTVRRPCVKG